MSAKSFYYECKQSEESDDRSSVSSIPWNSDAIKQNQLTWERVERILHNEEPISDEEPDLRQEITDWQMKFPQITKSHTKGDWMMKRGSFNTSSTNISEIADKNSSLDNDSNEDDQIFDSEIFASPDLRSKPIERWRIGTNKMTFITHDARHELADVFDKDLHITPLTLRQRRSAQLLDQRNFSTTSSISDSPVPAKATKFKNMPKTTYNNDTRIPIAENTAAIISNSRFHMPPILNVLETKRRFCGNRSFVQLTQIQQAKSAAVHSTGRQPPPERQYRIWNKPLAAVTVNSRFLNNRNAIILPSLRQQQHQHLTATTTSSNQSVMGGSAKRQFNSFSNNTNSSICSGDIRGRQRIHCLSNQTTTTSTSGRSISAVPMHLHGSFYHL